jgi:peptidoglycan hydrolase FlgJ
MQNFDIISKNSISSDRVMKQDTNNSTEEKKEREKRLKKVCADFESLFIYHMLKKMRSTIPKSGLVNEMKGKDTYETIMDQKVSEDLSNKGGVGIQKMLFNQIKNGR